MCLMLNTGNEKNCSCKYAHLCKRSNKMKTTQVMLPIQKLNKPRMINVVPVPSDKKLYNS